MDESEIELGQIVTDAISGYTGVVNTIGHHISGCTRIGVYPVNNLDDDREFTTQRGSEEFFYPDQLDLVVTASQWHDPDGLNTDYDVELGDTVEDSISGFEGTAVVINHLLFNVPQVAVRPEVTNTSEKADMAWFDIPQLSITEKSTHDITEPSTETAKAGAIEDSNSAPNTAPNR